jgi:hypothetical protein
MRGEGGASSPATSVGYARSDRSRALAQIRHSQGGVRIKSSSERYVERNG